LTETSYPALQRSLASVLDRVANDHEIVIIRRRGQKDVAIVAAGELAGLMETVYLLRSPKNARRLLSALNRATARRGKPESLDQFRKKFPR
jgi:antitoxin YefM